MIGGGEGGAGGFRRGARRRRGEAGEEDAGGGGLGGWSMIQKEGMDGEMYTTIRYKGEGERGRGGRRRERSYGSFHVYLPNASKEVAQPGGMSHSRFFLLIPNSLPAVYCCFSTGILAPVSCLRAPELLYHFLGTPGRLRKGQDDRELLTGG
eukprot:681937-Hanusia_phi.AAC.1